MFVFDWRQHRNREIPNLNNPPCWLDARPRPPGLPRLPRLNLVLHSQNYRSASSDEGNAYTRLFLFLGTGTRQISTAAGTCASTRCQPPGRGRHRLVVPRRGCNNHLHASERQREGRRSWALGCLRGNEVPPCRSNENQYCRAVVVQLHQPRKYRYSILHPRFGLGLCHVD